MLFFLTSYSSKYPEKSMTGSKKNIDNKSAYYYDFF